MESFFFFLKEKAQQWKVIFCYEGYFTPDVIDFDDLCNELIIYVLASSNKSRFYLESI